MRDDYYGAYGAIIYNGNTVVAKFSRAEDGIACLRDMAVALKCTLRLVTIERTNCRIPWGINVYGNEFHYRPQ